MDKAGQRRLDRLIGTGQAHLLRGGLKGIEKESLRVTPEGRIAHTPHPEALGSALTHPYITTDFSEALLEFITPPQANTWAGLQCLCDLHQFVHGHIGTEFLWAASMPCILRGDDDVPIADYGRSNVGTMKKVYRRGLSHRYGRAMQAIAGVHFNYSLPEAFWPAFHDMEAERGGLQEFVSECYFRMLRNFRRWGWLVLYLFGASPAVCKSFSGDAHGLDELDATTWYGRFATSLRMSDIGYKNQVQSQLAISLTGLDDYVAGLSAAIETPYPAYEAIGVRGDGEYRQLNANILQIENEYYSLVRPKRVARSGEKPTAALRRAGVEYVELRALDVSPFDPVGVNQAQLNFLEALLVLCLLSDSPPISAEEQQAIDRNQLLVAVRGRDPDLRLARPGRTVSVAEWAAELGDALASICETLDGDDPARGYSAALAGQREPIGDPEATPSARLLAEMRENGESFFELAMRLSAGHRDYFRGLLAASPERLADFSQQARRSVRRQQEIEAADEQTFEEYLAAYFAR